jgi:hypothetical protein
MANSTKHFFSLALRIKPRTLCTDNKCSTSELYPQTSMKIAFFSYDVLDIEFGALRFIILVLLSFSIYSFFQFLPSDPDESGGFEYLVFPNNLLI